MPQLGLHAKAKQRSFISTVNLSCTSFVKNFGKHLKKCKVSGFPSVAQCNQNHALSDLHLLSLSELVHPAARIELR
jgi:hypothetical protein